MTDTAATTSPESPEALGAAPDSRARKVFRRLGWTLFALLCLIFFTIVKLPQAKVKGYVQSMIAQGLSPYGITLTAGSSSFSFLLGITYTMQDVTLNFPSPKPPVHVDRVDVSPSLLPLLLRHYGGSFKLNEGDGTLKGSFSASKSSAKESFKMSDLNLGRLGLLSSLAGVQGSAIASGAGDLQVDLNAISGSSGHIKLKLDKIVLDSQNIQGFAIPRVSINDGEADIVIDKAKATINTLRIGKFGNPSDDLTATVSGDVTLGRQLQTSTLNLRVHFGLSPNLMKSFSLLDALLGAGKKPDGTFMYRITGPIFSPSPVPDAGG